MRVKNNSGIKHKKGARRPRTTVNISSDDYEFLEEIRIKHGLKNPEAVKIGLRLLRKYIKDAVERGDPLFS